STRCVAWGWGTRRPPRSSAGRRRACSGSEGRRPATIAPTMSGTSDPRSLLIRAQDNPGVLHRITGEIVDAGGNIVTVETREANAGGFSLYPQLEGCAVDGLAARLRVLPFVVECTEPRPFGRIFGGRVIVIGGG